MSFHAVKKVLHHLTIAAPLHRAVTPAWDFADIPKRGDPRWEEYKTCKSKYRFAAEPVAGDDCMSGWLHKYRCKFCDGWHLTSNPQKRRRRIVANDNLAADEASTVSDDRSQADASEVVR